MLYLSGTLPANTETRAMFDSLPTGLMGSPDIGYDYSAQHRPWAADNACFNNNWVESKWLAWLERHAPGADRCLFAVCPDVVGDHAATLALWPTYAPQMHDMGYRVAFVAQDGCGPQDGPWDECDAVFIGGTTEYKLGDTAHAVGAEAVRRGKWLHMGRVNSLRRMKIARSMGCHSVDGTTLVFGPDMNTIRLARWFRQLDTATTPIPFEQVRR